MKEKTIEEKVKEAKQAIYICKQTNNLIFDNTNEVMFSKAEMLAAWNDGYGAHSAEYFDGDEYTFEDFISTLIEERGNQ